MINKKSWFLVATLLILLSLYFGIKFGTAHGMNEINPETGEARLTEECQDRDGIVIIFSEFFICN